MNYIVAQNTIKDKSLFLFVFAVEAVSLLLLLKSIAFSVLFSIVIIGSFIIYTFPEFGFAIPYTVNILLYFLFDHIKVTFIAKPAYLVYLLLISISMFIFFVQNEERYKLRWDTLTKLVFFILAIMIFGVLYSSNKSYGMMKIFFYVSFNIPLFLTASLLGKKSQSVERLFAAIFIIGIVIAIFSHITAHSSLYFKFFRFRLSDSIGPISLGRALGMAVAAALFFVFRYHSWMLRFLIFLSLILIIPPISWTGSRAPTFGILVTFISYFILQPKQPTSRKIFITVFLMAVGAYYLVHSSTQIAARMATPITAEASSAFRLLAWLKAAQDFIGSPLLGVGTGGFMLDTPFEPLIYAHNLILELASENGIFGFVAIITFLALVGKTGLKNIRHYHKQQSEDLTQISIAAVSVFIFCLWNAMFSGDIYVNGTVWWTAGLIWGLKPEHDRVNTDIDAS